MAKPFAYRTFVCRDIHGTIEYVTGFVGGIKFKALPNGLNVIFGSMTPAEKIACKAAAAELFKS